MTGVGPTQRPDLLPLVRHIEAIQVLSGTFWSQNACTKANGDASSQLPSAAQDNRWSSAIAARSLTYGDKWEAEVGIKPTHRDASELGWIDTQRKLEGDYGRVSGRENGAPTPANALL